MTVRRPPRPSAAPRGGASATKRVPNKARARARVGSRRRLVGGLAATVILVGVLFVAVFPVSTYRTQRAATGAAEAELRSIKAEQDRVKRASVLLETDAEIERRAREDFGFQLPGEEIYNIIPAASTPIGLPETWPFSGVERALGG